MATLIEELDYRRESALRHRENSARHAQAFGRFTTTGQGTLEFDQRLSFDLTFLEEPVVSYGCSVNAEELADLQGLDQVILPNCTGFVTEWDQDERDFYVGAWMAVRVHFPLEDFPDIVDTLGNPLVNEAMNQAEVRHFFTFSAVAMKDVPIDLTD